MDTLPRSAKFIPQLDALRGLAILQVMFVHFLPEGTALRPIVPFGDMGVDLFFVLSGFLITGILLDAKPYPHYFANFYARRILRIWPLYYSLLVVVLVLAPHLPGLHRVAQETSHASLPYVFFLQNFLVPGLGVPWLSITWSLAIEEQFYLVWPLVVRFCKAENIRRFLWCILLFEVALRLFMYWRLGFPLRAASIRRNFFGSLDGLAAGGLLATYVRSSGASIPALLRFSRSVVPVGAAAFLLANRWAAPLRESFLSLALAALVVIAMYSQSWFSTKFLTVQFLLYTGRISFGLYLLHPIAHSICTLIFNSRLFGASGIAGARVVLPAAATLLSYLLATLSWVLLEKPFLSLKSKFQMLPGKTELAPAA